MKCTTTKVLFATMQRNDINVNNVTIDGWTLRILSFARNSKLAKLNVKKMTKDEVIKQCLEWDFTVKKNREIIKIFVSQTIGIEETTTTLKK